MNYSLIEFKAYPVCTMCLSGYAGDCVRERQLGAGVLPRGDQEERPAAG